MEWLRWARWGLAALVALGALAPLAARAQDQEPSADCQTAQRLVRELPGAAPVAAAPTARGTAAPNGAAPGLLPATAGVPLLGPAPGVAPAWIAPPPLPVPLTVAVWGPGYRVGALPAVGWLQPPPIALAPPPPLLAAAPTGRAPAGAASGTRSDLAGMARQLAAVVCGASADSALAAQYADLVSLLGYLQGDVADALEGPAREILASGDSERVRELAAVLLAAIATLRRGGAP